MVICMAVTITQFKNICSVSIHEYSTFIRTAFFGLPFLSFSKNGLSLLSLFTSINEANAMLKISLFN